MTSTAYVVHAVVAIALIVAYVVLSLAGQHDLEILGVLVGYVSGAGIQHATNGGGNGG